MVGAGGFAVAAAVFWRKVFTGLGVDVTDEAFFATGGAGEFAWGWIERKFVIHGFRFFIPRLKQGVIKKEAVPFLERNDSCI